MVTSTQLQQAIALIENALTAYEKALDSLRIASASGERWLSTTAFTTANINYTSTWQKYYKLKALSIQQRTNDY
jgi:hypothetical protein